MEVVSVKSDGDDSSNRRGLAVVIEKDDVDSDDDNLNDDDSFSSLQRRKGIGINNDDKSHENEIVFEKSSASLTEQSSNSSHGNLILWELPDILLYRVGQFASLPTERASFFCHRIAPLCKASYRSILEDEVKSVGLWDLIMKGDYGILVNKNRTLRQSKRLKRSPALKVRDAHRLMITNTELAYSDIWELGYSSAKKNALKKQKMIRILNEYGPVMVNRRMASGGNFLVEIVRSRNTSQSNILLCVKELVERRGALVNLATIESKSSSLTALCVASVRGMPRVVEYLLSVNDKGRDSLDIRCSGKFRLFKNSKKNLRCTNVIPLEFAQQMLAAETKEGASKDDLKDLNRCIKVLEQAASARRTRTRHDSKG